MSGHFEQTAEQLFWVDPEGVYVRVDDMSTLDWLEAINLGVTHLSLLCKVQADRYHIPCHSKTCDGGHGADGAWCGKPCDCTCHTQWIGFDDGSAL